MSLVWMDWIGGVSGGMRKGGLAGGLHALHGRGGGGWVELTSDALEIGFLVWCRDAFDAELFPFR